MPSPGNRRLLEGGARTAACLALGALLWRAWFPAPAGDVALRLAGTGGLPQALARAVRTPVASLDLAVDSLPGASDRAVARAVAAAGTTVRWTLAAPPSVSAAVAEPLAEPSGRVRLVTIGRAEAALTVRDAAGAVDSARLSTTGVRAVDATMDGVVQVHGAGAVATTSRRDSLVLRPVLVLGRAGWEGKFVAAALEEAGWRVETRFSVAPLVDVRQGAADAIDTSRYSAVVVLDESAASRAAAIARYARSGGGVIVTSAAARLPALASVLPARAGEAIVPTLGALSGERPRRALGGVALTSAARDAVTLERTGNRARIVAARVDAGRVLMMGYDDTWRWRMEGDDTGPSAHRAWWSSLVSSVAYAPPVQLTASPSVDEAPLAALVEAWGPPGDLAADTAPPVSSVAWDRLLFAAFLLALLAEWSSRRLRGAR
ncbi:MAG: hypothetical protein IPG88_24055 [Gemmatimonadetes bacterium]|nr:hypothetical protein [Gemmatimonadota bacterium]